MSIPALPILLTLFAAGLGAAAFPATATPKGLSTSDWSAIQAEYERHRHAAVAETGGYKARNPGQQWVTHFDRHGFTVQPDKAGTWWWGLELQGYGFAGRMLKPNETTPEADANRIRYQRGGGLEEWLINDGRGLEQGFTLHQRPPGDGAFRLDLAVRGGLDPRLDGSSVSFVDGNGAAVIRYAGLKAWDADGKALETRFEIAEERVRLIVDERGARYPVTVDPVAQQAYLKPSNTGVGNAFGWSVAVSGDTAVVGAPGEASNATGVNGNQMNNSAIGAGAAYVFVRSGTAWSQQAYLKASNTAAGDGFGQSVAVSGDTVLVGAPNEDSSATGVNGDQTNNSASFAGAVYVFTRSAGTWTQQAYLKASNAGAGDLFGLSVTISGDTVAVGAPDEDSNATGVNGDQSNNSSGDAGAAYVFVRSGSVWTQQAYLKASNPGSLDFFGLPVAISGDTVVAGAYGEASNATGINGDQSNNSAGSAGAAYVFVRSGIIWSQQAYLKASNSGAGDLFGYAAAVSGDTVVIGAPAEDSSASGLNGDQSNNSSSDAGAAYVFVRNGSVWSQQAYMKASNPGSIDQFGQSVAVSGDVVVAGAHLEDSNATGINGNQADNSADGAGAAYVFVRNAGTWTQLAYLKASNAGAGDEFSYSVAVSGDTVVAGALLEDSNATGVNGGQADNSAPSSGAAYVFSGVVDGACIPSFTFPPAVPVSIPSSGGTGSIQLNIGSGCAWTASSSLPWFPVAAGSANGTGTAQVKFDIQANNTGVTRAGSIVIAGITIDITQSWIGSGAAQPKVESVVPTSGTGFSGLFTFNFSDPDGFEDLNILNVIVNTAIDGRVGCYIAFVRPTGTLFLVNDAGDAGGPFAGSITIPGSDTVGNSQCSINATGSSVSSTGNNVSLTLNISFTGGFGGRKVLYLAGRDVAENNSGWHAKGVWTVPFVQTPTAVVSMTPARTEGNSVTLTTVFSDINGFADLNVLNILINDGIDGRNACYIAYVRPARNLILVNDAGDAGGSFAGSIPIPGAGIASNSQCAINAAGSSMSESGNTVTVSLNFTFTEKLQGDRIIYSASRDVAENNSGWQAMATITVPAP